MNDFAGYIFDLDGTIYLGDNAIAGAAALVGQLQKRGKRLLFLTNKTIDSREKYVQKLNRLGMDVSVEQVLNPAVVTVQYLHQHYSGGRVYVIGESVLKEELAMQGIRFAQTPEETDVVVVSWDRDFHYRQLDFAYQALVRGAAIIATHPDRTCPMEEGEVPDCGGMIGAIEGVIGRKIETMMGKPSALMAHTALNLLQISAKDCLMTGDRLETDVLMGKQAGMRTALVLTGVTRREEVEQAAVKPDYVLDSVVSLMSPSSDICI